MERLAVVTGASSGIGEAFASQLAKDGWDLVVVARRGDRLAEIAGRLTGQYGAAVRVVEADLASTQALSRLCAEMVDQPVDMLVNNAGLAHYMPFSELPSERAQELVQLNVLAPVMLTRAVIPGMVERRTGSIVNVASLLAFSGSWEGPHLPKRAVYAASKSFLVTFTQTLAGELRGSGVQVQALCPGVVRSEFHDRQGMDMSAVPRMEPADVVRASLLDLDRGAVVSIPGADDSAVTDQVEAAQRELMGATRTVELPDRYSRS